MWYSKSLIWIQVKLRGESPLPDTTGNRAQITYTARAVPDRSMILERGNKPMLMYLGVVVSSVWYGVALVTTRQVRTGRTWDPAQMEWSATAESAQTRQGKERPGEECCFFFRQLCCLFFFFLSHFISFPYQSSYCSLNFIDCVSLPSQRRTYVDFKGRRKTVEAQTFMSEWTLLGRGSALCWCGLDWIFSFKY